MRDQFKFSSAEHAPEAAFGLYQALYSGGSDVSRGQGPFSAEVRAWRLDKMLLFERRLSGVVHTRGERIARDDFDHFVVTLVLSGELVAEEPNDGVIIRAGEMILIDTQRPMRSESRDTHMLTASIARDVIQAALGAARDLHGQVLRAPDNLVLADYLTSLARRADTLSPSVLPALSRAFIDILASVGADAFRQGSEGRRQALLRRETVDRYLSRQIANPNLSVETISAATGISRSSLYRLFEKQGGVARFIQARRLDGLRAALDAGSPDSWDQLARRYGLASAEQVDRLFLESLGMTAEAYRSSQGRSEGEDLNGIRRRWAGWMTELR